jgi:TRAP transporter 4TM/12TM fusion protein
METEPTESAKWAEKRRNLTGIWRWVVIILSFVGVVVSMDYVFMWGIFGVAAVEQSHYYLLIALFLSPAFLYFPPKKGLQGNWAKRLFWFDVFFFSLCMAITLYFCAQGFNIILRGWAAIAPPYAVVLAVILWAMLLESLRRSMGLILTIMVAFFSLYPTFAEYMPGPLEGIGYSFVSTATLHIFSIESTVGMLMKVYSDLVIGFIVFGTVIVATGGGKFFLDLATAIVGRTRGGPAKVSVIGSALFGSMSGAVIANVVTTGSVTIPAMKKSGYPPHYAGAIEACASTGGAIAPPIMGAVAFVLASFIEMSYAEVALAAAIPAFLYFFGLFIQVDGYAAKHRLHGLPRSETPPFRKTLKAGWYYLPTVLVLVYYLFIIRVVHEAPWVAAGTCLLLAQIGKQSRFTIKTFLQFVQNTGRILTELCAVMSSLGMMVGTFAVTGIAVTFAREILTFAGGQLMPMLFLSGFAALIMGMGMPAIACYIFLAIVVAPGLVAAGVNELSAHLFIMYCGVLSYITPPVAIAAFPAGIIAEAAPMKVATTACRLGGIKYFLPFLFVLDPALLLQGGVADIIQSFLTAMLGVFIIGSALENYFVGIGMVRPNGMIGLLLRTGLIIGGTLLGLRGWRMDVGGLIIVGAILSPQIVKWVGALRSRETGQAPFAEKD